MAKRKRRSDWYKALTSKCSDKGKRIYRKLWTEEDDEYPSNYKHGYHPIVGKALVELCKQKLYTQEELGEHLGFTPEMFTTSFTKHKEYVEQYKEAMRLKALHIQKKILKKMKPKARKIAQKHWRKEWDKHPPCKPKASSTYHPVYAYMLPDMFANGESDNEVCVALGISVDRLTTWAQKDEFFREKYAEATRVAMAWWETQGRLGCVGKANINSFLYKYFMFNRYGWANDMRHKKDNADESEGKTLDIRIRVLSEEEEKKIRAEVNNNG